MVKGASAPLSGDYTGQSGIMVHGDNGLGGVQVPEGIIDTTSMTGHRCDYHTVHCMHTALKPLRCVFRRLPCSHTSAAQFIVDTVALHPGEVTLIALGPLTNVARAIQLGGEPFRANLRALSLMGGSFTGRGNKTPAAEANVHNDPEAAKVGSVASSRLPGQRREAKGALDKRQDPPPCATLPLRDLLPSSQLLRIARPHTKPKMTDRLLFLTRSTACSARVRPSAVVRVVACAGGAAGVRLSSRHHHGAARRHTPGAAHCLAHWHTTLK